MKPQRIDLSGARDVRELARLVLQTRFEETRALAHALERREGRELHDFRIACKRLRYAVERFEMLEPSLGCIAERLTLVQDALGEAHDREVLLAILPPTMPAAERRLRKEREACVDRAAALWRDAQQVLQALDSHRISMVL